MTSFTVVKKGEEIQFDSAFADVNEAKTYLLQKMSYNDFAMNLVEAKKVSAKQIAWMHYLATQDVIDSQTPVEFGPYKQLVNKMYDTMTAKKFQVRLPGMTLSTVNKGANIGCVYVFENGKYVGKITSTGDLKGDASEDVLNMLEDANDNLLQLAKIYGHQTGTCSICARTLNDPLSVQMGIGPVCAKRLA